jgi:hypothetical protein
VFKAPASIEKSKPRVARDFSYLLKEAPASIPSSSTAGKDDGEDEDSDAVDEPEVRT